MSTLTMKPLFSMRSASGSRRDVREQDVREAMLPRRARTTALTAGVIAVSLFSILAPTAGNPAQRLFALDATPTIAADEAIAQERPFELRPALMGPAITSEVLMMAEEDALHMPALEIRVTPIDDEVVVAPRG
jgi:hypothetical protein